MIEGPDGDGDLNVRADSYLVARARAPCPHCRAETRSVALVLPPGHEMLSAEDGTWERESCCALLFHVDRLPEAVRRQLQALAPAYRPAQDSAIQEAYWANHCERCGRLQEDQDLFCEPEGAFLPVSSQAAGAIELLPVEEPIQAGAAGYALDPEFLELGVRL